MVASFWVQTEPLLISALCCHTAPQAECYKRHSLKKQAEVSGVTVCFSVITVTSINNRIMLKMSHLCIYYSPHTFSLDTHTQVEKHPLLQYQQVNWICYLHWISFLKAAAEREAAGCCLRIQLFKKIKCWKTHLCCQKSDEWRRTFLLPPQAPSAHAMSVTRAELRASLPFPSQILSRCEQQN